MIRRRVDKLCCNCRCVTDSVDGCVTVSVDGCVTISVDGCVTVSVDGCVTDNANRVQLVLIGCDTISVNRV